VVRRTKQNSLGRALRKQESAPDKATLRYNSTSELSIRGELMLYLLAVVTATLAILYAPFAEWALHRNVMHRRLRGFSYPFKAHALKHHRLFKADFSYHLQDGKVKKKIRMAWWNGVAIAVILGIPFYLVTYAVALCGDVVAAKIIGWTSLGIFLGYYATYEYLHWCMHEPKNRMVERLKIFQWLNGHHILHHKSQDSNFNVVLPLADWVLGTLLLRARREFNQVRGLAVPDVQP
jgi:hypothetical protein